MTISFGIAAEAASVIMSSAIVARGGMTAFVIVSASIHVPAAGTAAAAGAAVT